MTKEELMSLYLRSPYLQFQPRKDTETDQMTAFLDDYFEGGKIILGGTGSSKTYTSCWALAREIYRNKAPAPNTPIWVISQTLDMSGSLYTQALSRFLPEDQIENIRWRKTNLQPEIVQLKKDSNGNNFNLHFFSYEQGRKALQSSNVWMAYLDEQCPNEIIEEVWGRLRTWQHNNMLIYSLTPLDPDPWLSDLHDRRNEPEIYNLWRFYNLDTMSNPHISEDWKKNYLDSLPPDVRLTRQYGQFSSYRGAVYPEFTNDLVIAPKPLEGKKYVGIDFGYRFPAAQWIVEENGIYYVTEDMQLQDCMPDVFAKKIIERGFDHTWKAIADYEDAISVRYLNAAGITTTAAKKNVTDGINNLKSLMFCKKFKVFNTCKDTIRQLKSYQWKQFPEDKEVKDEVKKVNDHLCIPEGQLIDTPNGNVFIENINKGNLIYSHLGIAEVQDIRITGIKPILLIKLDNGYNIQCSEEHPFKIENEWISAKYLKPNQILYQRNKEWKLNHIQQETEITQNISSIMETDIIDTQNWKEKSITETDLIFQELKDMVNLCISSFINKYGLTTMEQFLKGWYYTTLTEIQETTKLQISNLRLLQIIQNFMEILNLHKIKQKNGMEVKKDLNGIDSMVKQFGVKKTELQQNTFVSIVEKNTKQLYLKDQNSVPIVVSKKTDIIKEKIWKYEFVSIVEKILTLINILRRNAVPKVVDVNGVGIKEITQINSKPVYSIKSSDGTFFVNGILVSNCDISRYITYTTLKSVIKPWNQLPSTQIKLSTPQRNPLIFKG